MTVEDAGAPPAENGEFWLFGYGWVVGSLVPSATLLSPWPLSTSRHVFGVARGLALR